MRHRSRTPHSNFLEFDGAATNSSSRGCSVSCAGLREELLFSAATRADSDIASLTRLMDQLQRCCASIDVEAGAEIELDLRIEMAVASWPRRYRH